MIFKLWCEDFTLEEIDNLWFSRGAIVTVDSTDMTFFVDYEK